MMLIDVILLGLLASLSCAVAYLYFLALIGLSLTKRYPQVSRTYDFLILVPAHNEGQDISKTLHSLEQLEPSGTTKIVVIADNCTDKTAEVARSCNIDVLERFDENLKGKGYALQWAISQSTLSDYDAVVIVDADTIVDRNMLGAMAQSFEDGAGAVQVYYGFTAEKKTNLSYLQQMASIVENILFYNARSILRLPILLRGNGMAIRTEVLRNHPWDSFSITEDVDYAVNLLKDGISIDFNINSRVLSAATSSFKQSTSQKIRWASGTIQLIREQVFGLIFDGVKKKRLDLIELGFSFSLLSRPLLIYLTLIVLVLSFISNSHFQPVFTYWCLSLIGLLIVYNITGIIYVDEKIPACKALFLIPFYGVWFLFIQITAMFRSGKLGWIRTDRTNNE